MYAMTFSTKLLKKASKSKKDTRKVDDGYCNTIFNGVDETVIHEIRLTKSKDVEIEETFFRFKNPDALLSDNLKEILGIYLIDEEGKITTREINITFSKTKWEIYYYRGCLMLEVIKRFK